MSALPASVLALLRVRFTLSLVSITPFALDGPPV